MTEAFNQECAREWERVREIVMTRVSGCSDDTIKKALKNEKDALEKSTKNQTKRAYKNLILYMQGGWTKQHTYKWNCGDSHCEDDARGPVLRTRRNPDGTTCYQSRTEIITNQSMRSGVFPPLLNTYRYSA